MSSRSHHQSFYSTTVTVVEVDWGLALFDLDCGFNGYVIMSIMREGGMDMLKNKK